MSEPKYPTIVVELVGKDGNAFAIMGAVQHELVKHEVDKKQIDLFIDEAMAGDYNHLLQVCSKWVNIY